MSFDSHANLAFSTVATGGAPSPATSGTSLTLVSAANFPDPATVGDYNITINQAGATRAQVASAAEIARVTAKAGNVLTIVRAAEGPNGARTVVDGDEVALTMTAKALTDIETVLKHLPGVNVKDHGAVGDVATVGTGGTDDTAAFNAAVAALPTVDGNPAGRLIIPAGVYRIDGAITAFNPEYVSIEGDGGYASILDYRGSGDCLRLFNSATTPSSTLNRGGRIVGIAIDGTGSGAGATGLHAGDVNSLQFDDFMVANFSGAGSTGVIFDNSVSYTERLCGRITVSNCTNSVTFTVSGTGSSTNSFDYIDLTIDLIKAANGVTFQNGATILHGQLRIIGNMVYAAGTNAALTITGQIPGVTQRGTATTGTQASSGGGTLTISKPTGVVSGDVLVAVIEVNNPSNVPATPAGWTLLDSGSTGPSSATYYKVAGGSEPSSYSWTVANLAAGVIAAYTGCDPVNPVNVHGALNRTTASPLTATSITTTAPCKIIFVAGIGGTPTITTPTGFTARGTAAGAADSAFLADMDQGATGATGNVTAAIGSTNNGYASLIALKPAGAHPSPNAYSNLTGCRLDVLVEVRPNGGSNKPTTIKFGAAGNFIIGTGMLSFQAGADSTGAGSWTASNNSGNLQKWLGLIDGDTALSSHNDWTPVAVGGFNNP